MKSSLIILLFQGQDVRIATTPTTPSTGAPAAPGATIAATTQGKRTLRTLRIVFSPLKTPIQA